MTPTPAATVAAEASVLTRKPRQVLLAFFGEYVSDRYFEPVRASVVIGLMEEVGFTAPVARTNLDRMVHSGILDRRKLGREIGFELTSHGNEVLREAASRVTGGASFDPHGDGWTLVTFSVPEQQRTLRHRIRAALAWSGFASLRDGLWIAPGTVDLESALEAIIPDLPPACITAFAAQELPGFSMADVVHSTWDIDSLRDAHHQFIAQWDDGAPMPVPGALAARTLLVADWLALLRTDPRLPREYMDAAWPADRSLEVFTRRHRELAFPAVRDFAERVG